MSELPSVIGLCRYCDDEIHRGVPHACEASEFEFACEPFYAIDTADGFALRDSMHRCIGTMKLRGWLSEYAKERVREVLCNTFTKQEERHE